MAIQRGNQESGGRVIEMAEAEYMVRASGYIEGEDDLRAIPVGLSENGTPILLSDIAEIRKLVRNSGAASASSMARVRRSAAS